MTKCNSIYNLLIKQIVERFLAEKLVKKDEAPYHFPTFNGAVEVHEFLFHRIPFTLVSHLQADGMKFVVKLYVEFDPELYFSSSKNKKFFSGKQHRQNDPCILKIIHNCDKNHKESWIETQLPTHRDDWRYYNELAAKLVESYSKACKGHSLD